MVKAVIDSDRCRDYRHLRWTLDYTAVRRDVIRRISALRKAEEQLEKVLEVMPEGPALNGGSPAQRERYVCRMVQLLRQQERAMTVSEMAHCLDVTRSALQHSIWMELNKKKRPRLERLSRGLYRAVSKHVPGAAS